MPKNVGLKNTKDKPIDKDGYPIKRWEICFQCKEKFVLTFSFSQQNYSRKHFWNYWTEKEEDKGKYTCSPCLKFFYLERRQEFLSTVKNLSKRNNLIGYIRKNFV